MLAGISTQIFYPHRLTPGHLDALAATGARVIEVFAARFHFDATDRQQLKDVAGWFRSNDVKAALHAPITSDERFSRHSYPNVNLVAGEKSRRIAAMDEVKRALEAAEQIELATCVLHLGLSGDVWDDYALEHALTGVEHLKAFAGPLGVKLLLENLRNEIATPEHLLEILRVGHFDSLGLCFDVGHAHLEGNLDAATLELVRGRVAEVHLHDNHGQPQPGTPYPGDAGNPDSHLWPASGTERPSGLGGGTIAWPEIYALLATLPDETPGVLEIHDTQCADLAFATKVGREVFSHAARLMSIQYYPAE